jgi:initiation factor 1A
MPKNKGSGGKKFRQNKSGHSGGHTKRELPYKVEAEEQYGIVTRTLGNSHFMVQILDANNPSASEILCSLKKSIRRKMHVEPGVLVLLAIRSYQTDHGDIIYPYDHDEREALLSEKHIEEDLLSKYSRNGKLQEKDEDYFSFGGNRNRVQHTDMRDDDESESEEEESSGEGESEPTDLNIDDI